MSHSASSRSATSFLFAVNELHVNEEPGNGGVPPRATEDGRWIPPVYRGGFYPHGQTPQVIYRWSNGGINTATGYSWYIGNGWNPGNSQLEEYRTTATFYCSPFIHFLTANVDPTVTDIEGAPFGTHRWFPLTFRHEGALSRVEESGEEYLAGTHADWIRELGLSAYNNYHAPQSDGLAGNIAAIIALVAFTCRSASLDTILLRDNAWRNYRWRGHNHHHGRTNRRGLLVNIYYDPENPQGSSYETLYNLEWYDRATLR